ncbi:hypothetical protein K525DRAFT_252445 [Schizophyllum commune Loenen D]|nr:hypothetical protein K525DRAFT_252445 [Schizophyllum commune Loenen D]
MYPAYYHQWPDAWRRNPHVHYASDVRREGKYTTKLPFNQLNYNGTEQAQHDPSTPNPLRTPRHTRQMLPVRPALRHLAPPPVLPHRPVALPPQTPAPPAYAYATPHTHQRAPAASASQQVVAPHPPPPSASNTHSVPLANPPSAAPPAPPVLGRMPIWSRSRNRWEGDFAYEAQAPSVPAPSSAPPAGAQTAVPPAATQITRPPPPIHQRPAQSVHYQAPSAAQPVQTAQDAPATAQTSSVSAHNPSYVAQAPTLAADQQEPSFPAISVGDSPPSSPVVPATQASASQLPVVSQTTTCSGAPHTNAGVAALGDRTPSNNGHLVLDDSTSIKHSMGVCALPTLLSPWETIRSVDVTIPVSVNDLQKILRRAHNLESASFASILPKTKRLRHGDRITLPNLERLVIDNIQASIRGVLKDLDAEQLKYLRVTYAPGAACNLWSDEQDYYMLLWDAWGLMRENPRVGRIRVLSNNEWYQDNRAAQFRKLLQEAVGAEWDVRVH